MGEGFVKPAHRKAYLNGQKAFEKIKFFTSNPGNQNNELLFHTSYLLGKNVVTNLDSILKYRDIALPIKVHLVKAMLSPVVTY